MRNVTILLAVAAVLALAAPASGTWVYWGGSSGGLYSVDTNWTLGAKPGSWKDVGHPHDYAIVKDTGYILQNTPEYPWDVIVGGSVDALYYVVDVGADLALNEFDIGGLDYGSYGFIHGRAEQRGGIVTNAYFYDAEDDIIGPAADGINVGAYEDAAGQSGSYKMTGGQIDFAGPLRVGGANASGLFHVVGTGPVGDEAISIGVASYNQGALGTLKMELNASGEVTPLNCTPTAAGNVTTLAGALEVDPGAYTPVIGDKVLVLSVLNGIGATTAAEMLDYTALGLVGASALDRTVNPAINQGYRLLPEEYDDVEDVAILQVLYTALGDANLDASVTGADYTLYAANYGIGSSWEEGDFNGDGAITGADYTLYAANYGTAPPASAGAVPEPITLSLLGFGGLALLRRRRR